MLSLAKVWHRSYLMSHVMLVEHPVSPILMPARSSYDILASDLHPLSPQNIILKYADDTYLVVPSSNRHTVPSELKYISARAINNNVKLNVNKSCELIIHGRARFDFPPASRGSLVSRSFPYLALP